MNRERSSLIPDKGDWGVGKLERRAASSESLRFLRIFSVSGIGLVSGSAVF